MFEQRIVELMKMENRVTCDGLEEGLRSQKPTQFKPSLMDRILTMVGEAMISIGLKLKDRPHAKLNTEQAQSPNYMIML
jgi:hypothetical protein